MDKDLKKLIVETINKTFKEAPEKLVERGIREIYYDICPHCKTEIHEKHEYTEDGGTTWRHSDCGGLIARPETPIEEVSSWLRPYVEEARQQRLEARAALGLAELPSKEPGGTMSAVNTSGLAKENERTPRPVDPYLAQDDEKGKPPKSPDNDPAAKDYDPNLPPMIMHPYPNAVPRFGVNENKFSHVDPNIIKVALRYYKKLHPKKPAFGVQPNGEEKYLYDLGFWNEELWDDEGNWVGKYDDDLIDFAVRNFLGNAWKEAGEMARMAGKEQREVYNMILKNYKKNPNQNV